MKHLSYQTYKTLEGRDSMSIVELVNQISKNPLNPDDQFHEDQSNNIKKRIYDIINTFERAGIIHRVESKMAG